MIRIKKLLPDEYYLDKNFMPLVKKIAEKIKENETNFTDGIDQKITYDELERIVFYTLTAIKPRYNIKTHSCY